MYAPPFSLCIKICMSTINTSCLCDRLESPLVLISRKLLEQLSPRAASSSRVPSTAPSRVRLRPGASASHPPTRPAPTSTPAHRQRQPHGRGRHRSGIGINPFYCELGSKGAQRAGAAPAQRWVDNYGNALMFTSAAAHPPCSVGARRSPKPTMIASTLRLLCVAYAAAAPTSSTVDVVLARYDEVRARFLPFHRWPQRLPRRTRASCWRSLCANKRHIDLRPTSHLPFRLLPRLATRRICRGWLRRPSSRSPERARSCTARARTPRRRRRCRTTPS